MTKILIDPNFHLHPEYRKIYAKTTEAIKKFPEIKEIILSAFYPTKTDNAAAGAGVKGKTPTIWFNIKKVAPNNIIYHELYHLLQKKPTGAKFFSSTQEIDATLLGHARMCPSKVDDNTMPYFQAVPKKKLVAYARFAAKEKAKGNKNYINDTLAKVLNDKKKDPKNKEWKMPKFSSKPVKARFSVTSGNKKYAKGHSPEDVRNYIKKNIKPDQQFGDVMKNYAYELDDFIKKPEWVRPKQIKKRKVKSG